MSDSARIGAAGDEREDEASSPGIITFYRMGPLPPRPMRADRSALGVLPASALQYCEAVTSASAFGWYAFAPIDFHVEWDGSEILWTSDGGASWSPLRQEHLPALPEVFDARAPEDVRGFAPPFLTAGVAPGLLQIWTGLFVRTRPGWSILVRAPVNVPHSKQFETYEGIVETDRWLMPLFANVRLSTTDRPIAFTRERPLVQIQPLRRDAYAEAHLRAFDVHDALDSFTVEDWNDYRRTVVGRAKGQTSHVVGRYAVDVRKRGR